MRRTTNSPRFPPYIKSFFVFHYFVKKASERACVSPRYPSGISRRGGLWEKIANESGERRDMEKKNRRRRRRGERGGGVKERLRWIKRRRPASLIEQQQLSTESVSLFPLWLLCTRYFPCISSQPLCAELSRRADYPSLASHSRIIRPTGSLLFFLTAPLLHLFSILATFFPTWADSTFFFYFLFYFLTRLLERREKEKCPQLRDPPFGHCVCVWGGGCW